MLTNSTDEPAGDSVIAWRCYSVTTHAAEALAARFLHLGFLKTAQVHRVFGQSAGSTISIKRSTFFPDFDASYFTIGYRQTALKPEDIFDLVFRLWVANANACSNVAGQGIDAWVKRQYQFPPFRRPYASRIFARVREAAIRGDDIGLIARPDWMAQAALDLIAIRSDSLIREMLQMPHVFFNMGAA